MKKTKCVIALYLFAFFIDVVWAQIPQILSYQGMLNKPDGDYTFTFKLYDAATEGNPLWTEQKTLRVKDKIFSTALGDVTPFSPTITFDKPYWLGVQIDSGIELSPRVELTSVGYAFRSLRADTAVFALTSKGTSIDSVAGGTVRGAITIDLENLPGAAGREAVRIKTAAGNDYGVISVNAPTLALYSNSDNRLANLATSFLNIDLTEKSKQGGRDGLMIRVSNDNDNAVLLTNTTSFTFWNSTQDIPADIACRDASVRVLTIRGGSDLAEPFEMSNQTDLPAGALVVIDKDNPGKLKLATEPYDKRVAGVISGAGGINPGLTLNQEGLAENGQHVALSGRVYALASTCNGPIEPGDLLTTSNVPGYAMKATNQKKWPGAVIGKAMTGLEGRNGLVLVLVQPN